MTLPNPLHQLIDSIVRSRQYDPCRRGAYAARFLAWQLHARVGPRAVAPPGRPKLTAILLSFKRVRNMEPLVRSLLRTDFVEKIVVSNNNPDYRIADWITLRDDRIHLIDQRRRTPPGIRFELARQEPGEYFISIDDDTLLYPYQVLHLFERLLERPSAPHGIKGELFLGEPELSEVATHTPTPGWKTGVRRLETRVDVLNCVYIFTREHVAQLFRLARLLGLDVGALDNGEDVLLSASGDERPFLHDTGTMVQCLSSHQTGVATWRTRPGFFAERTALLRSLRALRSASTPR